MSQGLSNNWLPLTVILPVVGGLLGYSVRRLRIEFNLLAFVPVLSIAYRLFVITRSHIISFDYSILGFFSIPFFLDGLGGTILFLNAAMAFLIWLHSLRVTVKESQVHRYYLAMTFLLALANAIVASGSLIGTAIAWMLCMPVMLGLLASGRNPAPNAIRSFLAITTVAHILFIAGLLLIFIGGRVPAAIAPTTAAALDRPAVVYGFMLIMLGVITNIGLVPLHGWLEDAANEVPAATLAYTTALVGRLVGIYLLIRIAYYVFDLTAAPALQVILMTLGILTILGGVVAELFRSDLDGLIIFNGLCQSGFIILGVGTGHPAAVAGALFHSLNCAFGQVALYLGAGSVMFRMKTGRLDRLGGLGTMMPFTFVVFLTAALALSGVPPLNGFYSKWLIYQGVIGRADTMRIWPVFLIVAMVGSVLTLASFLKMVSAVFLGEPPAGSEKVREARFDMTAPTIVVAALCVLFGLAASPLVLRQFIFPALPFRPGNAGLWQPLWAGLFIAVGLGLGLVVYLLGNRLRFPKRKPFIGGETLGSGERLHGLDFYSPLHDLSILAVVNRWLLGRRRTVSADHDAGGEGGHR